VRPPLPPLAPPARRYRDYFGALVLQPSRSRSLAQRCVELINRDRTEELCLKS
jgi:hypothetical protein